MNMNHFYGLAASTFLLTLSVAGFAAAQTVVTTCQTTVSGDAVLGGNIARLFALSA